MRYPVAYVLLGVLLAGCSLGDESYVTVDGERVWMWKNGIARVELNEAQQEWSTHLDVGLKKYYYRYAGPPALLHMWIDVNRNGTPAASPIISMILANRERPQSDVNMSGIVLVSERSMPASSGQAALSRFCIDVRGSGTYTLNVPFEQGIFYVHGGVWASPRRLEFDRTWGFESVAYYTKDHAYYKKKVSGEPYDATFTVDPGPGKTVLTFKTRLTAFNPKLPFVTVRENGSRDSMGIGTFNFGLPQMFYRTTDQREPGFQAADAERVEAR